MHCIKQVVYWGAVCALSFCFSAESALAEEGGAATAEGSQENTLRFNPQAYSKKTLQDNHGTTITFRAYEQLVYVKHPVDSRYQCLNIYIPEAYFTGQAMHGYTAETAPIFFPNMVGGYMSARPGGPDLKRAPGKEAQRPNRGMNASFYALAHGYVVASPGVRGRTTQDARGRYTGKAPACIVDLKAAVRYLRLNDARMPGDAEKIVSNGTSAGGALSALLGASGNSVEYRSYLRHLGAADEDDDIFAASCYCPITDLDHADAAYEWQFAGEETYSKLKLDQMTDWHQARVEVQGRLSPAQLQVSQALRPLFPRYLNTLHLHDPQGRPLHLDRQGEGSFKDYLLSLVQASAQQAVDQGQDLSALPWVELEGKQVRAIDFSGYLHAITRMKTPPAFDALDLSSGENSLFGTVTLQAQHFTSFSYEHSQHNGATLAAAAIIKLLNPMRYIGHRWVTTASHWRIRQGTRDRDTSLAIPVILATTLSNKGYAVDFALPWDQPHGGDYDLNELFAWIDSLCQKQAGAGR